MVALPRGTMTSPPGRTMAPTMASRGSATIEAGDRVIFFALSKVVPKLQSAFLADAGKDAV